MILAREVSDNLTSLVKKVDEATVKNAKAKMGSFVVVCNDDEKMEGQLKSLAKKEDLKKCVLTLLDRRAGPPGVTLHPQADVTVILYVSRKPQAQYAFKKGDLGAKDIEAILGDLPKILKK